MNIEQCRLKINEVSSFNFWLCKKSSWKTMLVILLKFCFENIFHEFIKREIKKDETPCRDTNTCKKWNFYWWFLWHHFHKSLLLVSNVNPNSISKKKWIFWKKSTINFYFLLDYYVTISCQGSFYQRNFVEALFHPWGLNLLTDLAYIFQPFVLHWQILQSSSINQVKCLHFQNVTFYAKNPNIYLIYSLFMFN